METQEDPSQQDRPRRQYQQFPQRSTASSNWRMKDDTPRAEPLPRTQNRGGGQIGTPRGQSNDQGEQAATRLYVGNLLYSAQRDDIISFFAENGFNVVNLNMSIDPMTGRNPSYCFVDFESADEASRAMSELNGQDVLGRAVKINPGVAKRAGDQAGGLRTNSYNKGWNKDQPSQDGYKPTFDRWNRNDAAAQWHTQDPQGPEGKRLYIGNLPRMEPQSAVDQAMQDLFASIGIELSVVSKIISPHESKKDEPGDHYYLFVDLTNAEDVENAIKALDGLQPEWAGGPLRVNRARQTAGKKVQREQGSYQSRRVEGATDWRRTKQPE